MGRCCVIFCITVIVFILVFALFIDLPSKQVAIATALFSSTTSSIEKESSKSTSDSARLWEQCDGKEYKVRRICEGNLKCYARDISYWQCRPEGNCPDGWTCTNETSFGNSSLSLEALKELLNSKAMKKGEPSDWSNSIVDLMKLLSLDFREHHLIQLALKLGFKGDVGNSYKMHIWLHKQLLEILAKNGGNLPGEVKDW